MNPSCLQSNTKKLLPYHISTLSSEIQYTTWYYNSQRQKIPQDPFPAKNLLKKTTYLLLEAKTSSYFIACVTGKTFTDTEKEKKKKKKKTNKHRPQLGLPYWQPSKNKKNKTNKLNADLDWVCHTGNPVKRIVLLETFRTLNDFKRKANKRKFAYVLKSTCSVTWYPWQQYNRSNLVFEFQESCLSLAWKVSSLNKQCGDKTYLLRSSRLSCALKFASLVARWYSAVEHLWIWLSVGVFALFAFAWSLTIY